MQYLWSFLIKIRCTLQGYRRHQDRRKGRIGETDWRRRISIVLQRRRPLTNFLTWNVAGTKHLATAAPAAVVARSPGTWNQGILVVRQRRGRKCTGNNNQWSCCIGVWRAVPAPPCCPTYFDRAPLPVLPSSSSLVPPFLVLPLVLRPPPSPSTIFADIDEPPCALLSSTWTLPDETRLDVLGREIDRTVFRAFPVSLFLPSSMPPKSMSDSSYRRFWCKFWKILQ